MPDEVLIQRLDPDLPMPAYARPGDAGIDLYAREDATIPPGGRRLVPTGIAIALPVGFVALSVPRSGFALRQGGTLLNSPGIIDAGYRGEIQVPLVNHDRDETIVVRRGDRIAQLVVQPVTRVVFDVVDELPDSTRGAGGFGSTGRA